MLANDDARAAVVTLSSGEATGGPANRHAASDKWLSVVADEPHGARNPGTEP